MVKEKQKRKHDRIGSLNLLNYVCLDKNNKEVNQLTSLMKKLME